MKLISLFKTDIIEFYCSEEDYDIIPKPYPAFKNMPEWFKKTPVECKNQRDQYGGISQTAKKCMPLVDAMSTGYIIPLFADVNIRTNKSLSLIEASDTPYGRVIEFHDNAQLGGVTSPTYPAHAIKFINRWYIKTAPGYSTLFMPPLNRIEKRFTCLSGLVDTDKYPRPINFPAIWHLPEFDEIVPAGTPLVTCIPIKRNDISRNITTRKMTKKEIAADRIIARKQDNRRSVYTNELRVDKK